MQPIPRRTQPARHAVVQIYSRIGVMSDPCCYHSQVTQLRRDWCTGGKLLKYKLDRRVRSILLAPGCIGRLTPAPSPIGSVPNDVVYRQFAKRG